MEELAAITALLLTSAVMAISATNEQPSLTPSDRLIIEMEQEARQKEQEYLQAYEQKDFDFMQGVVYEPSEQEEQNGTQH